MSALCSHRNSRQRYYLTNLDDLKGSNVMNETTIGLGPYSGPRQRKCSIEGCDGKYYMNGLCQKHANRMRRHGSAHVCIANEDRRHVKLSAEKAAEIRALRAAGFTLKVIASSYDEVTYSAVQKAAQGKNWKVVA